MDEKHENTESAQSDAKNHITKDINEIRRWAEERGGQPAKVTGSTGNGILRIKFSEGTEDSLENITWDELAESMNKMNLAFLYQDKKASGEKSTFFKFVDESEAEKESNE